MGLEMKSRALYRAFPNAMGYPHYSAGSGEPPWVFEGGSGVIKFTSYW